MNEPPSWSERHPEGLAQESDVQLGHFAQLAVLIRWSVDVAAGSVSEVDADVSLVRTLVFRERRVDQAYRSLTAARMAFR